MKVLIIGAGNMGKAFIESFLKDAFLNPNQVSVIEKNEKQQNPLKELNITNIYPDFGDFVPKQDVIILATKPQDAHIVYSNLREYIQPNQIILSIMAGITIETISQQLGTTKIVRCMPNLPCQLGIGVTGFYADKSIDAEKAVEIKKLIECTGLAIQLKEESELHSITAISGSGPAYVFYFMNAMIEQAKQFGYSEDEACNMVAQTFEGAVALYKANNLSCLEWINRVASKGGTTEAAISKFNQLKLDNTIQEGMQSALNRSVEMSKID
ncbi:MAG: pyrroline-5-carboxylate reductase [Sphingobacteriales bacterium]|nr:MAG: pyrroline-5-carboxylate reductase [Sphingobacteriales bacterium]